MEKANIILHDIKKNKIGIIGWSVPGSLRADLTQEGMNVEKDLEQLLKDVTLKGGLPYTDSQKIGEAILEKTLFAPIADKKFPFILIDLINKTRFGGKRIFAIMEKR